MAAPDRLKAALHTNLGLALRRQRKDQEAMDNYDRALALDPGQAGLAVHRAEALQNLERYDEALAVFKATLAQEPENPELHRRTNDLLYRLNRPDEYLKSYDRAPESRALKLGKAFLLSQEKRGLEALEIYRHLLQRDPQDAAAILGAAGALTTLKRAGEAVALIEPLLAQGEDAALLVRAAEAALQCNDPQKAEHFCRRALVLVPYDQLGLANIGLAWRMMGDEREAALNRYDDFVRIYDLEPPEGFASMKDFNAELCVYLDRLHPRTREYVDQSLRGGTQTPDHIFGAGHDLIDRLEVRIAEAVQDYIGAMRAAENHPLASRRRNAFDYAGSWSSRLTNCGFHVNHVHPAGWISSCYYVGVPAVVEDAQGKQGWIKFGEPAHDVALADPVRRAVQPVPGRLVLFPSYMWHGTIPFQDDGARTTIAFDVIPKG
jgi:tetratricopeptide (TPR) repeat protein